MALLHLSDLDLSAQEPSSNKIARKSHATCSSEKRPFVFIPKLRAVSLLLGKALEVTEASCYYCFSSIKTAFRMGNSKYKQ